VGNRLIGIYWDVSFFGEGWWAPKELTI